MHCGQGGCAGKDTEKGVSEKNQRFFEHALRAKVVRREKHRSGELIGTRPI